MLLVKIDQSLYCLDLFKILLNGLKWFNLTEKEQISHVLWIVNHSTEILIDTSLHLPCALLFMTWSTYIAHGFYLCVLLISFVLCAGAISNASRSQVQRQPLRCLSVWRVCVVCRVSCQWHGTGHCLWKFQEPDDCFWTARREIVVQIRSQMFEWI